uniref:Sushi domain-containing protein n=1 Tax=Wuchereria bancrofti TaxID=6293 RepID=A0AAF5Q647_WUCBA
MHFLLYFFIFFDYTFFDYCLSNIKYCAKKIARCSLILSYFIKFTFSCFELINLNALKYPHGTIAMLICPSDHYLEVEGSRWRVCMNGTWSGSVGQCKQLGT